MKIRKIIIKNLNSLQLEKTIDFMATPFSETGLFAITGETGAGKTTILDALTLGLYGRMHRNKQVNEVLSYGAVDCLAEVEFEVKGECYLAHWDIYRARKKLSGKIQPATRQLRKWDDKTQAFEVITDRIREVDEKVEEITGLDYDRFCRSVLLSQGDFAAFLKSGQKERSDLLERITGTEIYSNISKAAYQRHKTEEGRLKDLNKEVEGLRLLEPDALKLLKKDFASKKKESKGLKKELDELQTEKQQHQQVKVLEAKEQEFQQLEIALTQQKNQQQSDWEKLDWHQKTVPFWNDVTQKTTQEIELNEIQSEKENLLETKKENEEKIVTLSEAVGSLKKDLDQHKKEHKEQLPLWEKINKIDIRLDQLEEPLTSVKKELEAQKKQTEEQLIVVEKTRKEKDQKQQKLTKIEDWLIENKKYISLPEEFKSIRNLCEDAGGLKKKVQKLQTEKTSSKKELDSAKKELDALRSKQEENQAALVKCQTEFQNHLPEKYSLERMQVLVGISEEIATLSNRQKKLDDLKNLNEDYRRCTREYENYRETLQELQAESFEVDKELLNSFELLDDLKNIECYKEEIYHQQLTIAKYEDDRAKLEEGDPCPVCLSTEHPFRKSGFTPFVDTAKEELSKARNEVAKVENRQKNISLQQQQLNQKIRDLNGSTIDESDGKMQQTLRKIQEIETKFAEVFSEGEQEVSQAVHITYFEQKINAIDGDIEQKKQLKDRLHQLNKQIDQLEKADQELKSLLSKQELVFQKYSDKHDFLIEQIQESKQQLDDAIYELTDALKPYDVDFNLEKGNEIFVELQKITNKTADFLQQKTVLTNEIAIWKEKEKSAKDALNEKTKRSKSLAVEVEKQQMQLVNLAKERKELFGEKILEEEKNKWQQKTEALEDKYAIITSKLQKRQLEEQKLNTQINALSKQERKLDKGIEKLTTTLLSAIVKVGFDKIEDLQIKHLDAETAEKIRQQKETLQNQIKENEQLLKHTVTELTVLKKRLSVDRNLEELLKNIESLDQKYQVILEEIGGIDKEIKLNEARKAQASQIVLQIEKQRKEVNRWKAIQDLIGSADGQKFRIFAQGLTLKKLVALANNYLQDFNARYVVLKPDDEDLELNIIDTYQADNVRSMNTLSGGESFLVSLALALGLSDLAGRNTNIQSLFIDEGFGTLDENTLDLAITTLENLQSTGKTIGIISHVKALKERITTQIQVRKKGNGVSEVTVIG